MHIGKASQLGEKTFNGKKERPSSGCPWAVFYAITKLISVDVNV